MLHQLQLLLHLAGRRSKIRLKLAIASPLSIIPDFEGVVVTPRPQPAGPSQVSAIALM
jgi:hypothetical protein